ncbi:MAG: cysteine desulfurase [DPANN group archaeon]|nr:cysteine desulfurase [DPANN group archaeon]
MADFSNAIKIPQDSKEKCRSIFLGQENSAEFSLVSAPSRALFGSGIRQDFPILKQKINGKRLVYLDSAATSQKPKVMIDALKSYYEKYNSNIHRAIHTLGEQATEEYESTRKKVAKFINAKSEKEIIFVRNTTEAINLVAYSWARNNLKAGDEIILTIIEHHSNIVPWQQLQENGIKLKFVDVNKNYELDLKQLENSVTKSTKLVSLTHVSNVLGTINPISEIVKIIKEKNPDAKILIDGAQAVPHLKVNVLELDCDFYAFSSHKMLGPTGVGVLYAKEELLKEMKPFLFGGDMIKKVGKFETEFNDLPWKFEAGTPNIADVIAFGAAIDYLENIGMENVHTHEIELTKYALEKLSEIKDIEIYGSKDAKQRGGVIAFNIKGAHPHDVAQILDGEGIAIRSGHACAMPLMKRLGVESVCRASFYIYNYKKDVNAMIKGLKKVKKVLKL